jgi:hypothetical protein
MIMIVFVVIRDFEKKNIFFDHINYIFFISFGLFSVIIYKKKIS